MVYIKHDVRSYPAMLTTVPVNSKLLRSIRESRRLSQTEVTKLAGIPAVRLSQYENDGNGINPPPEHILRLAHFYNLPARSLLTPEGVTLVETSLAILGAVLDGNSPPEESTLFARQNMELTEEKPDTTEMRALPMD